MMKNYTAPEVEVVSLAIDECVMGNEEDVTGVVSIGGDY